MMRTEWFYTRLSKILVDALVLCVALTVGYVVRFDGRLPPEYLRQALAVGPYVLGLTIASLIFSGTYNRVWRYSNLGDVMQLSGATLLPASVFTLLRLFAPDAYATVRLPLSVIATYFSLGLIGTAGARAARRLLYERQRRLRHYGPQLPMRRVLIAGAGDAGIRLSRDLAHRPDVRVVAFVDDDQRKFGTRVDGVRVRGTTKEITRLVVQHRVDEVIVALPVSAQRVMRDLISACEQVPVRVRILPPDQEQLPAHVSGHVRDVRIEDLLTRDVVSFDLHASEVVKTYEGRSILVTGAGGSIGSELCRQLLSLNPAALLLLDQDENNLFEIYSDLIDLGGDPERIRRFIVDARNHLAVAQILREHRPEVLFHGAAFKHVPFLEGHVVEAVENNVLATAALVSLSVEFGVRTFVLISTDKAVRPSNVMGATKRAAELVVQAAAARHGVGFSCVRFGNVLDSRGSVIPIFRRQIARGGPVTVTHEEATRYFMTIAEAAQFVLTAGSLGRGGDVLVLDMGAPVRILDVARDIIHLSGLREPDDIKIKFVGLRPGERLHEELVEGGGPLMRTAFDKILAASPSVIAPELVDDMVRALAASARQRDTKALLQILCAPPIGLEPPESAADGKPISRPRIVRRSPSQVAHKLS